MSTNSFCVSVTESNLASKNVKSETARLIANFHPSVWANHFLNYTPADEASQAQIVRQIDELKECVKTELIAMSSRPQVEQLSFIDAIQRLGVGYHFEKEIEDTLRQIYETYDREPCNHEDEDLHHISVRFHLLRRNGFHVSSNVFGKFKDDEGSFKGITIASDDVQGILSLYEASHLRIHGEDILDEAVAFTCSHLKSMAAALSDPMVTQVRHALTQPFHKGMLRVESRHWISMYEQNASHNKDLLKLAKLDFNLLQTMHNMEIKELSRWWRDLNIVSQLPIRDRVPEAYFWSFGPYYEPEYSLARMIFCKVFKVTSIIDDIYDAYGTIDELELFTAAVERWDISCISTLPEYMKMCYEALLSTFEQFERDLAEGGRSYRVHYAREQVKVTGLK
ncbi:hypothetical protein Dimus_027904 [Dionaea muscipula]